MDPYAIFEQDTRRRTTKTNNEMSNDMRSVPDLKTH